MNITVTNQVVNNYASYPIYSGKQGISCNTHNKNTAPYASTVMRGTNPAPQQTKTVQNNNLGIKLLVGSLAIIGGIFALKKLCKPSEVQEVFKSDFKNIESIRKNLSEIFEKDFTVQEADEFAKNYKQILEIKDDKECLDRLFKQLKNDYGFKNSNLELIIEDFTKENAPKWSAGHMDLGYAIAVARIDNKLPNRKNLFGSLFHEFKHHKQFEISVATDKHALEDAIAHKKIREYTQEQIDTSGGRDAVLEWLKEQGRQCLKPEFDRIEKEIGQLPKDSPLYKKGLSYIEAKRNYIQENELTPNNEKYYNNILEIEAHKVGNLAKEIFDWLI